MKTRNTKQKQMILDTLVHDKTHPTIQELYEKILSHDGDVGQATIYRNVNKMVEENKIRKVRTLDGIDRYDGDMSDHCHLVCQKCGRLVDVFDPHLKEIISLLEKNNGIVIQNHNILLEGICPLCVKGSNDEEVSM